MWVVKMRLDAHDRRALDRRLKGRLSPHLYSKIKKVPVVLAVTVSFWFSAEVLADIVEHPETIQISTTAPGPAVTTYSKDQLAEAPPEAVPGLQDELRRQVGEVFKTMIARQDPNAPTSLNQIASSHAQPDRTKHNLSQGALVDAGSAQNNAQDAVTDNLKSNSSKALAAHVSNNLEAWQKLQNGFNFNLDFGKMFGSKATSAPTKSSGKIRYGLIVKDIVPDDSSPKHAAATSMTPEEVERYAGEADVVWTIGPITDDAEQKLSAVNMPTLEQLKQGSAHEAPSTWQEAIPRAAFTGKITPNFASDAAVDSGAGGAKPGVLLTLSQVQGYYEMAQSTVDGFKPSTLEHQFNAPVVGTLKVGRRYNDKMEVIKTSASEILVDKRLPSVNVAYMNKEDRYEAGGRYARGTSVYEFIGSTPKGWKADQEHLGKTPGEKYEVRYTKAF